MNFYRCNICGNVIEVIEGNNKNIKCCGKEMELLIANSVDASLEKHVPSYKIIGDKIEVTIGETIHPMELDHYIMWIALVKDNKIIRYNLKPNDKPKVIFPLEKESIICAYCNKHGLWKKEI